MTSSAIIWSAALQSAATFVAGSAGGARWGIDQLSGDVAWAGSAGPPTSTAGRVVELAVHIVLETPTIPKPESHRPRKRPGDGSTAMGLRLVVAAVALALIAAPTLAAAPCPRRRADQQSYVRARRRHDRSGQHADPAQRPGGA
jgi:hypothetical protein